LKREEEELRVLLEGLGGEVERVRNRSNELWNGVGGLKLRKQELVEWSVADENGFNQILEVRQFYSSLIESFRKSERLILGVHRS